MVLIPLLLIIVGLVIVVVSADEAIKRLLNLAQLFRLPEFVISVIIAGIIAVLPELSIGVVAAFEGNSALGFGVILGANVADLTLAIGVVALFSGRLYLNPDTVKHIKRAFLAVLLPVLLFVDGDISQVDGIILLFAFGVYLYTLLKNGSDDQEYMQKRGRISLIIQGIIFTVSVTFLFIGGSLVSENAQQLSLLLGLPLFLIGVIVAIGTCLPEMTFAVRASKKEHGELGLGNILGNVLADSMLTIGVIALIQPIRPDQPIAPLFTGIFMVISAVIVYIITKDGVLDRKDGALLTAVYSVFLVTQYMFEGFGI